MGSGNGILNRSLNSSNEADESKKSALDHDNYLKYTNET